MKIRSRIGLSLALLALLNLIPQLSTAFAQGTAFTYEGQLQSGGSPANGTFDLTFSLYNAATGGTAIAGPVVVDNVVVVNGLFIVTLDFGSGPWNGQTDWLQVGVKGNGDAGFTTLTPRQQVTPTPYAICSSTANGLNGTINNGQLANSTITVNPGSGLTGGGTVSLGGSTTLGIAAGGVNNSMLADPNITVTAGTGLSGGGTFALGGSTTLNNNGVISLTGGDGVTVSGATGNLTLGLGSSLTLGNLPVSIYTGTGWLLSADMNGNYFAGIYAGNPVQPGVNNTAEGSGALQSISSGSANTANGEGALQGNNSGSDNTANGSGALSKNGGGSYNVADGANSLSGGRNGFFNTALGYSALSQSGQLTSAAGSNNIAIGYQAGSSFSGIESSNIDIGNIGVLGEGNVIRIGNQQTVAYIAGVITGNGSGLTDLNASQLTSGTINNSQLANSTITINSGAGLSSSGSPVALGGTVTLNNTGVTSLTGGDGVTVSGATGNLTLGLGSSITLTGLPASISGDGISLFYADINGNYYTGINAGLGTSGTGNTATGANALLNTSGSDNTAAGVNALGGNSNSGSDNTADGANALSVNGTGSFNTANGASALGGNESGSYNVGDGADALGGNFGGTYNTAVGYSALSQLGDGPPLGHGGTNNIAIGYGAGSAYTFNESSNIDIGNIGVLGENNIIRIGTPGIQTTAYIAGVITGNGSGLTDLNASQLTSGTINNSQLANSTITISTGAGLSSSGSPVALGGTITLNNTGVTSLTGGDGVTVSGATGNLTLGLGNALTLTGALPVSINTQSGSLLYADNNGNYFAGVGAQNPSPSGSDNTASGSDALASDTSGYANAAYGAGALQDNTSGYANTAEGVNALQDNMSGNGNTANGENALFANQSGSYNTASGAGALGENYNGSYNTAAGVSALTENASGSYNTANGNGALQENETGSYNVGDGADALQGNEGGSYNTALGPNTLSALGGSTPARGGSNNIAIGYGAGSAFTGIESSNIDIGNVGVLGDGNVIRIGNQQAVAYIAGVITGNGSGLTDLNASQLTSGTINNSQLANSSITISTGVGLSSSGSPVALGGTITLNNTGVTSLTGSDGVTVSGATGNLTLGLGNTLTLTGGLPVNINTQSGSLLYADNNQNYLAGVGTGLGVESGSENTASGFGALLINEGSYNTAAGFSALDGNTTGSYNAANGYEALNNNQRGLYNVAEGANAITGAANGSYNTALGAWAYSGVVGIRAGSNNIAIGYQAGSAFTGLESSNIDIGNVGVVGENNITRIGTPGIQTAAYIAGIINGNGSGLTSLNASQITGGTINNSQLANNSITINTGSGITGGGAVSLGGTVTLGLGSFLTLAGPYQVGINTPIGSVLYFDDVNDNYFAGFAAGNLATSGAVNTATGSSALENNTSGSGNSAYGYEALSSNTGGNWNTANGEQALFANTTGTLNIAVGMEALNRNTTGSTNIAIGYLAGSAITGNNNIDIGNAGNSGDSGVTRIGTPGIQTTTSLAGICNSHVGYGCLQGTAGTVFGNTFNFWWTGSQLQAWVDNIDIGVVQVTSDRRLKENIEPMTDDALSRVMTLKPSTFKYKNIPGTIFHGDGTQEEGFIADELQAVIPSAVNGEKDGLTSKGTLQPQTVNLMPVVAVLTKAVQDQQKEIDELKAMVKTLSERK